MKRTPIAALLCLGAVIILCLPASAAPKLKPLPAQTKLGDRYQRIYERVDHKNAGPYDGGVAGRNLADDGIFVKGAPPRPPTRAELLKGISVMQRMLNPPAPPAVDSPVVVAAAPAATSVPAAPVSTGGCPSYMAAEATSPSAVNPTSGAAGCFQILPSTAAAHGCTDVGPSCAAAICATEGPGAWASSGANPCPYVQP